MDVENHPRIRNLQSFTPTCLKSTRQDGKAKSQNRTPKNRKARLIFIKFGQFLSSRPDIISPAYCVEFTRLLDKTNFFPRKIARQIFETEFQTKIEQVFHAFDTKPLAAASFGQFHVGQLRSGEKVTIKFRKLGIAEEVQQDLSLYSQ